MSETLRLQHRANSKEGSKYYKTTWQASARFMIIFLKSYGLAVAFKLLGHFRAVEIIAPSPFSDEHWCRGAFDSILHKMEQSQHPGNDKVSRS